MSVVTLVSGGVDSSLVAVLAKEAGAEQHPLFVDYGQLCAAREWDACTRILARHRIPRPRRMNLSGFGKSIPSGLTSPRLRVNEDAFLPGRNLLFLVAGAAYAYSVRAASVSIGLLSEECHIFPDQTSKFLTKAEELVKLALGYDVRIAAPLMNMDKRASLALAAEKGIRGTYSCHAGTVRPCGKCISCLEAAPFRARRR